MKYFIIEIEKSKFPVLEAVSNSDFDVIKACESYEDAETEVAKLVLLNISNQTGLHYEIIQGDGAQGHENLKNEISEFLKSIK